MATLVVFIVASVILTAAEGRQPVLHHVGGSKLGWKLGVNYTDWASHEHFYVGDWLYFGFDKYTFSVLQVNKTGYNNCIETTFIKNITRGGRDVFNLSEAKPHYFISGRGFCYQNVKLAILHVEDSPPAPAPSASFSDAASYGMLPAALSALLTLALALALLFPGILVF